MPARAWGFESPLSHQLIDLPPSIDVSVGVARALRARRLPAVSRQPYANPHPTDLLGCGCELLPSASVLARFARGGSSAPAGGRKPPTALSGLAFARPAIPSATATNRCPSTSASPPFRTNHRASNRRQGRTGRFNHPFNPAQRVPAASSHAATWRRWRAPPVAFSVDTRKIAYRQTQSRDGAAVPNDHSLLVWVLDQTLGLLKRSARTAEEEEAVKELRTQALLPKPDKARIESLVHRLETMVSITPELMRTHLPPKRAGVMKARPVRITLDRELNRLIESIGKKTGANRTPAKKAAGKKTVVKAGAKKTAVKGGGKKTAARIGATKTAVKAGGKKAPKTVAGRKTAKRVGGKRPAASKNVPTKRTRA